MTNSSFSSMKVEEERDLARRLADSSDVFNFEKALEVVQFDPVKAERLLRDRERHKKLLDELAQANERLHRAAREFR